MRILVGKFTLEANANIPTKCDLSTTLLLTGEPVISSLYLNELPEEYSDVELVPTLYADAGSSGVMVKPAFEYISNIIFNDVKKNIGKLDGIMLFLHGASYIDEIGSGDHYIIREIRKIVGPYMPVAVVCDPHGNLTEEYVNNLSIIRSFRESPHTDIKESVHFVFKALVNEIRNPRGIQAIYRKLPIIIGGEQSVSADEPVCTINKHLNELQEDPAVLSASWHVGYIRHDCPEAGAGIVVTAASREDIPHANKVADELAAYVFSKRNEFHYTGLTASPEEALKMALECEGKPAFITDSGDNVTSGSTGCNTFVLRQFMALENLEKKVLFAAIHDDNTYPVLASKAIGETVDINLGMNYDELSTPVPLTVKVLAKGRQAGSKIFAETGDWGGAVRVEVVGKPIEIIVTDTNHPFVEPHQCMVVGADWTTYDIVIVKTGYAFPEVIKAGKIAVMSLTEGATLQDTARLPFKLIMRPMWPIDKI